MFSRFYQEELTYLRDLGRAFARLNPALAGSLEEAGTDPDVERLLEGFAFLTARVRERLEDGAPEVIEHLAALLLPHYLRSTPACSVLQFTPNIKALRSRQTVPRNTEVATTPVQGTSCRFQTTSEVDLLPLAMRGFDLDESSANRKRIRLMLEADEQGRASVFQERGLRFFLDGQRSVSTTLFMWLMRHVRTISCRNEGESGPGVVLPPDSLRPAAFSKDTSLIPWPETSSNGLRLVQEYLTLPEKFLFLDIINLHYAKDHIQEAQFEIIIDLGFEHEDSLPAQLGQTAFRLFCTPVVNLFSTSAAPIRNEHPHVFHLVRPQDVEPSHAEVYTLESVTAGQARGQKRTYEPFFAFRHTSQEPHFYHLRRETSILDGGTDIYLAVSSPKDTAAKTAQDVLSIDMTCTNRFLPNRLGAGAICQPTPNSPTVATFRNITRISKPVPPLLGTELHWRFIAHLAINRQSLMNPEVLRALLRLYNQALVHDDQGGRANERIIDAITRVEGKIIKRMLDGAPVRGHQTFLKLNEDRFTSPGDAFLFGCVLDELFASQIGMNSFNELVIELDPSERIHRWSPRSGHQYLV